MRGIMVGSIKKNPTVALDSSARNRGSPRKTCTRKVTSMAISMSASLLFLNRQEARPIQQGMPPEQGETYGQSHDRNAAADAQAHGLEQGNRLRVMPAEP